MTKQRRKGSIFIDWMRNNRTATAILPWSLRARPGAPVAIPLDWREFSRQQAANAVTIRDAATRDEPWSDFFKTPQSLRKGVLDFLKTTR